MYLELALNRAKLAGGRLGKDEGSRKQNKSPALEELGAAEMREHLPPTTRRDARFAHICCRS